MVYNGLKKIEGPSLNRTVSTRVFETVSIISVLPILNILVLFPDMFERTTIVFFYVVLLKINFVNFFLKKRFKLVLTNQNNKSAYLNYLSITYAFVSMLAIIYTGI